MLLRKILSQSSASFRCLSSDVNSFARRTHNCGQLRLIDEGKQVVVCGWLMYKRMGKFLVLKDAYGLVQTRIPEGHKDLLEKVEQLNYETVVKVKGTVVSRGQQTNPKMETGEIEIVVDDLEILNETPSDMPYSFRTKPHDKTRLTYRYLDLRSSEMQSNLRMRSSVVNKMRKFFSDSHGFVEVETPTLFRRTPGGANEFIVPSPKPNLGKFYSLPQSPQQFKQLLMCGGIDRYYQIARCYRDEGSKSDRQPEFTQVDYEISFTDQKSVMDLTEKLIYNSWPEDLLPLRPEIPFRCLSYADSIRLYGTDKPDLRIPWTITDCTEDLQFLNPYNRTGWICRLIVAKDAAGTVPHSIVPEWQKLLAINPKFTKFTLLRPGSKRWFKEIPNRQLWDKYEVTDHDILIVSWGEAACVQWTLGQLRNLVAEQADLRTESRMEFAWITDFPLFIRNDLGQLESAHHPFTAPVAEDEHLLFEYDNLEKIRAQHYDLVLNGVELGGGSIRIHKSDIQRYVIEKVLGEEVGQLEHLIEALSLGAPPHGGFAIGLDRYIALLAGKGDPSYPIRNVIAFPKTKDGRDLMSRSPVEVSEDELKRYGIMLRDEAKESDGKVVEESD
ncbi:hypothetical protein AB6A40_002626 [Gnathostoma spinigerum]|uniref:Aminoacyl-transfer RNA synthetases class-II family profile domain-containing protein n=1 Tax=Gnathostoma spinigerum TaxID=75299 RepID=A0ABD6EGW4_9BILA